MTTKALVTGGCGFIGSNLANRLHATGWCIDVVDNLSNGHLQFLNKELHADNLWINDFTTDVILDKIRGKEYDYVFHLAANPRVGYSVEHPYETNDVNVTRTLKLIDTCRGNIKKFIFASTSAVYGNVKDLPTSEDSEINPESPYGLQKYLIEQYLRMYWKLYQFDSACMRFFNVFGPNQLGDSPYSTAVSAWLTAVMKGQSLRSDGDGTQTRDMVHVDNVVDACIRAAIYPKPLKGEAFNVACGQSFSNLHILSIIKNKFPQAKSHDAPWRPGDVKHTLADIDKIKSVLGYTPIVQFEEGLDLTMSWHIDNGRSIEEEAINDNKQS